MPFRDIPAEGLESQLLHESKFSAAQQGLENEIAEAIIFS